MTTNQQRASDPQPSPPYQAVILAAGRGSRLGERTGQIPKALLPIGPRAIDDPTETSFLQRQVELLVACGTRQIVVVVGYLKQRLIEAIAGLPGGLGQRVQVVVNTTADINRSGSLHSFQFAARAGIGVLDGQHQTLLLDADIVYERRVLELLLQAPPRTAVQVCRAYHPGDEEVLVYGPADRPRFMGKGLHSHPELVCDEPCLGEATGMVKFAPADHALVRRTMSWMLGDPDAATAAPQRRGFGPARQATEHEELTQRFMHYGRITAVTFGGEARFMEVDSEQEYARLRDEFYPRLLAREARP